MGNFKNKLKNYQNIPRELVFDTSLSDRARFVFCYMAAKPDDWDFYLEPMAKEIGYGVGTLRKYIKELVESGWLTKGEQDVKEGRYGAVEYTLNEVKKEPSAEKPSAEKQHTEITDTEKNRHDKSAAQIDRDKERKDINSKEKRIKDGSINKFSDEDFLDSLVEIGVDRDVAEDWMAVRKSKRATNTRTAFKAIEREIAKSKRTPTECIEEVVMRNWTGFKAEWLENKVQAQPQGQSRVSRDNPTGASHYYKNGKVYNAFGEEMPNAFYPDETREYTDEL